MDNYEVSFTLILHAGNAKSAAMMAIEAAREGTFEEAQRLLEEAKKLYLYQKISELQGGVSS